VENIYNTLCQIYSGQ